MANTWTLKICLLILIELFWWYLRTFCSSRLRLRLCRTDELGYLLVWDGLTTTMTMTEHDREHKQAEMVRLRLNTIADTNKLLKPFCKGENDFVRSRLRPCRTDELGYLQTRLRLRSRLQPCRTDEVGYLQTYNKPLVLLYDENLVSLPDPTSYNVRVVFVNDFVNKPPKPILTDNAMKLMEK